MSRGVTWGTCRIRQPPVPSAHLQACAPAREKSARPSPCYLQVILPPFPASPDLDLASRPSRRGALPVSVKALALQSSRNCSPAPDFGALKANITMCMFFLNSVSFLQTPVSEGITTRACGGSSARRDREDDLRMSYSLCEHCLWAAALCYNAGMI